MSTSCNPKDQLQCQRSLLSFPSGTQARRNHGRPAPWTCEKSVQRKGRAVAAMKMSHSELFLQRIDRWPQLLCSDSTVVLLQKLCCSRAAPSRWLSMAKVRRQAHFSEKEDSWWVTLIRGSPISLADFTQYQSGPCTEKLKLDSRNLKSISPLPLPLRDTAKICQGNILPTTVSRKLSFALSTGYFGWWYFQGVGIQQMKSGHHSKKQG